MAVPGLSGQASQLHIQVWHLWSTSDAKLELAIEASLERFSELQTSVASRLACCCHSLQVEASYVDVFRIAADDLLMLGPAIDHQLRIEASGVFGPGTRIHFSEFQGFVVHCALTRWFFAIVTFATVVTKFRSTITTWRKLAGVCSYGFDAIGKV